MLSIALPAAVALAADPIASLIDTAFVGHIGTYVEISLMILVFMMMMMMRVGFCMSLFLFVLE